MQLNWQSDLKGCWSILWRALVFMPWMVLVFLVVSTICLGCWVLPIFIAVSAMIYDWPMVEFGMLAWVPSVWIYRRYRIKTFLQWPASLL